MSHQRPITLADIERGQKLFTNRTAVAVLDILGRGERLPGPLRTNQRTLDDAVALLNQMELVDAGPDARRSSYRTVILTPRGRSVADLLEEISDTVK